MCPLCSSQNGSLPETSLTSITMVTSCLINHDGYLISGLLHAPSPNLLTNKQFLVMTTVWVTWPVSGSCVCCFSFLLIMWSHPCSREASLWYRPEQETPISLYNSHGQALEIWTINFWDKVLLLIAIANSSFAFQSTVRWNEALERVRLR